MEWYTLFSSLYTHCFDMIIALLILLVGFCIAKITRSILCKKLHLGKADATLQQFFGNIVFTTLLIFTVIIALGKAGIPTASLITAVGATGLAIGLALQTTLANVASGLFIIALRLFRVGDVIESNGVTGEVEKINMFNTQLRNGDDDVITLPNAKVANDKIIKKSRVK